VTDYPETSSLTGTVWTMRYLEGRSPDEVRGHCAQVEVRLDRELASVSGQAI
jgi:hypothetical protein